MIKYMFNIIYITYDDNYDDRYVQHKWIKLEPLFSRSVP